MFSNTDLICREASPTTPTEKFFESDGKLSLSQDANITVPDVSAHLHEVEHKSTLESLPSSASQSYEYGSSPLSEASSGYESLIDEYSQLENGSFVNNDIASSEVYSIPAKLDHHMLTDLRVLGQMLKIESLYVPWNVDKMVYQSVKYETDEKARRIVTEWMLEVCEELKCEEVTFPLAVNYLDRFILATPELRKPQLQLVAVVCLLIASKLRQCEPLDPKDLSYMTDNSATVAQILTWETLILKRLNWDVSSILATDYLDHILVKLSQLVAQSSSPSEEHLSFRTSSSSSSSSTAVPGSRPSNILSQSSPFVAISSLPSTKRPLESSPSSSYSSHFATSYSVRSKRRKVEHSSSLQPATLHETVRRHASTLISLCSTELQFASVRPSVIAAACVATAVRGIFQQTQLSQSIASALASFAAQLQIDINSDIDVYVNRIESLLAARSSKLGASGQSKGNQSTSSGPMSASKSSNSSSKVSPTTIYLANCSLAYFPQLASSVHSSVHSTEYSPSGDCLSTSVPSSRYPSLSSFHYQLPFSGVPTAQVAYAKHLLLSQQQQPSSSGNRAPSRHYPPLSTHYIPEASSLSRCSHSANGGSLTHHLHDSSNTSSSITFSDGAFLEEDGSLKSKLVTLNMASSFDTFCDEEDRENMAPLSFVLNGSSGTAPSDGTATDSLSDSSDLTSSEDMPFFDDEEDSLHDYYRARF